MPTPRSSAAALVEELWLPTGQAARMLGISQITLKRYADRDGFLVEGINWRRGHHHGTPRVWELHSCKAAISWRGRHGRGQKPSIPPAR